MKTLYVLKKYNNYFNRIVKKEKTITDYVTKSEAYNVISNANFYPADGVSTTHVHKFPIGTTSFEGDYLLVVNNGRIESRWFILENLWDREGQYILTLRRDLIVDFYDEFAYSGFYCMNGIPSSTVDPSIYNKEPIEYNEIKAQIEQIQDPSKTPWIICYVEPYFGQEGTAQNIVDVTYLYEDSTYTISLDPEKVQALDDAPYAAIALPLLDSSITFYQNKPQSMTEYVQKTVTTTKERTLAFLWALQQSVTYDDKGNVTGGVKIYDIQLLPYCPFQIYAVQGLEDFKWTYNSDGTPGLTQTRYIGGQSTGSPVISVLANQEDTHIAVLAIKRAQTYRYINMTPKLLPPLNPITEDVFGYKLANELFKIRLTDQFGSSSFDFSLGYNRGNCNLLVAQTLKPWQSNVYIRPQWEDGGLYKIGSQNLSDDKRGLVCKGPFTMPQIEDAWKNYAQNNVNYGKMFNRQIENLETNNAINNKLQVTQGVIGMAQAGVSGFSGGVNNGSPVSALIGSVAGTAASAIGFRADYNATLARQAEQIDYAKDTFAMQIGNIRAMPDTLTSVSVFDWMAPWWPLLEVYGPSAEEIGWFAKHLKYHGCTINHLTTFDEEVTNITEQVEGDYYGDKRLTEFVRGVLFRCNLEDSHAANELASELLKGVYIKL
jgi:hypothetical protein